MCDAIGSVTTPLAQTFFLDPCSGLGSIPIELMATSRRDNLNIVALSADIELPSLANAEGNNRLAGLHKGRGFQGLDAGLLWDGRGLPFSSGFRDEIIDGIVCDLPWGVRELSMNAVGKLYPAMLDMLGRACSNGAYAVFLCSRASLFTDILSRDEQVWEFISERVSLHSCSI